MSKQIRKKHVITKKTPVRVALRPDSLLHSMVKDGLGAVMDAHRSYFDEGIRPSFADSLDIDKAFKAGREQENRWDYLLGHKPSKQVIGVEPHSAENGEIDTVIKKAESARGQLMEHVRDGVSISKWLWVASGRVHLIPMEKATLRLDQNGIKFVGRKITNKHLA